MWGSVIFLTLASLAASEEPKLQTGRSQLARAMFERRSNHFDRALALLDQAEANLTSPRLLAEVCRQRAMIFADTDRPQRAVRSFIRAFTLEPNAPDARRPLSEKAKDALVCARKLHDSDLDERAWTSPPSEGWQCPAVVTTSTTTGRPAGAGIPVTAGAGIPVTAGTGIPVTAGPAKIDAEARRASDLIKTAAQAETASPWPPPTATVVLGGISLASLGAGVAMGALSAGQATDADASTGGRGLATAANVTFAVAAAAATTALLWWVLDE